MSNLTPPTFGQRLAMFRTLAGYTSQASAADVAGVARNTWGRWEAGTTKPDSAEWTLALQRLIKVHPGHATLLLVNTAPLFPEIVAHDPATAPTSETGGQAS